MQLLLLILALMLSEGAGKITIVFVHLGDILPEFMRVCLSQTRLFNRLNPMYLIADAAMLVSNSSDSAEAVQTFMTKNDIVFVPSESLYKSTHHVIFNKKWLEVLKEKKMEFWHYTTERFFYIEDFMMQNRILSNVVHMETDVMLYCSVDDHYKALSAYKGIAVTADSDQRVIPGFVFFSTVKALRSLNRFILDNKKRIRNDNDMSLISRFKGSWLHGPSIGNLPIVPDKYAMLYKLKSKEPTKFSARVPVDYYKHFSSFNASVFDAAALGQYIGGVNPKLHARGVSSSVGFVNEGSLFDPSLFIYEWEEDQLGRRTLKMKLLSDTRVEAKICTLHIHSKRTAEFYSLQPRMSRQRCDDMKSVEEYSKKQKMILNDLYRRDCTK